MPRRRSLDGQTTSTKNLKPKPTTSASTRASPIPSVRGVRANPIPFPRGGRQIGTNDDHVTVRRSNSIERSGLKLEGRSKKTLFWP